MSDQKKKYDTDDVMIMHNARLVRDAEVKTSSRGEWCKFTVASDSKREGDETMWIEVIPNDYQVQVARNLRKGDVLSVEGKLTMRRHEGKVYFTLRNARLHLSVGLLVESRGRGDARTGAVPSARVNQAPSTRRPSPTPVEDDLPF